MHKSTKLSFGLVPLILSFCSACSGRAPSAHQTGDPTAIEECDAFLQSYEHCLQSLGSADIAQARIAQTREALVAEGSRGDAERASVRRKCSANLTQMKSACP